ncbi:MAG: hypothetical protein HYY24_11630 [Verrucomicrobia bacterium]|nr:hypothetical protein [Verrucomicrobiota bacterium]
MSLEDTIGYQHEVETCVVCGKNVEHGGGFARIHYGELKVAVCCPLCQETFQADPKPYLKRLGKVIAYRELRKLNRPGGQSSA